MAETRLQKMGLKAYGKANSKRRDEGGLGTTEIAILVGVLVMIAALSITVFRPHLQALWDDIAESSRPVESKEAGYLSSSSQPAEVVRVVDGDTLLCLIDGEEQYVRLIGVDTPESVSADESNNCDEGKLATEYTRSLVCAGQTVYLTKDTSDTDKYDRLLRYVWLAKPQEPLSDDLIARTMVNALLVKNGYAQAKAYPPDTTFSELFAELEHEAMEAGVGVAHKWSDMATTK